MGFQCEDLTHLPVYSPLSFLFYGIQVHDVRFQTQTAEEKEAWIKALSNGINRAKNTILDEVNVACFYFLFVSKVIRRNDGEQLVKRISQTEV